MSDQPLFELHAIHDTEVEVSVRPSPRGWRARLRLSCSEIGAIDALYANRQRAEAAARGFFRAMFPGHACDERCQRLVSVHNMASKRPLDM